MTDVQRAFEAEAAQREQRLSNDVKAALFDELFALLGRCGVLLLDARTKHESEVASRPKTCQIHNGLIQPPSRRTCTCGRL